MVFERWASDARVTRYLTWRPHRDEDDTRDWLRHVERGWEGDGDHVAWIIETQPHGPVGAIGLTFEGHRVTTGYAIAHDFWGRGYATEATRAIVALAAGLDGVYRVWAFCDVDNHASARVLEKAGLIREGVFRRWVVHPSVSDEPRDAVVFVRPT